ncbi:type IV secretion system protein [Xanthomonas axonopodis pv. vasculorum]|uniref:type IV secretion system protein n=2 Tax=Xanthomonas axonopodis TaxID=53413 RepID=UPI0014955DBB|nr:type IV secretion system protein [Xanthomonas axonopodis]QKD86443.1 type IV secretion system protein [Xanthomonas axonopodis pv. vasculorum]
MNAVLHGTMQWLQPMADANIGDFVFFKLVSDYFSNEIASFGLALTSRAMHWVRMIALTVTTLWILMAGYRIATGQSREHAMATVVKALRIVLVVALATTVGVGGAALHKTATDTLDKEIHQLFTGEEGTSSTDAIDKNLAYSQVALSALDAVRVMPNDPEALEKKGRAILLAGFGTASPPMAAGAMLLLFKFTLAFLIGVGPIFIFFLAFDQTKDLFKRWLFYVIGTLFSMAMLSVVTGMVLKFTAKVAAAYWAAQVITLGNAEGLSSYALQQGGIGVLMTLVLVTVPTAAAAIWQGQMGNFMYYSAFGGGAASTPGPQGQPPGAYVPQQPLRASNEESFGRGQSTSQVTNRTVGSLGGSESIPRPGSRGNAGRNESGSV